MRKYISILVFVIFFLDQTVFAQPFIVANFESEVVTPIQEFLVFQSGFEGTTRILPYGTSTNDQIIGSDPKLVSSNWNTFKINEIRTLYINYAGGDTTERYALTVTDPTNPNNKVLHYYVKDYWLTTDGQEKSRCQIEFYDIKNGYKEFYQSVRVYLTSSFDVLKTRANGMPWFTIAEFWNNEGWAKPYGFRISVGLYKYGGDTKNLYFSVSAEDSGPINVWSIINRNVIVPIDQWFTIDYYFREGNKDTGRFYMAITPVGKSKQIICDVYDITHNTKDPTPDGLTGYNPMKLYTSKDVVSYLKSKGVPIEIYWDDFKLWTNKRP